MSRVLIALALLAVTATAGAQNSHNRASADEAVQQALSQVYRNHQGRVLSARPVKGAGGRIQVRVKFLSKDGVIKVFVVDPNED